MFGNNPTDNQTSTTATTSDPLSALSASPSPAPIFGVDSNTQNPLPTPTISSDGTLTTSAPEPETSTLGATIPALTQADSTKVESEPEITMPAAEKPSDDLLELKKDALSKLGPLVDKLDQTPEEKFKTTMMMIQASDDQKLIPKAYEAANSIEDEKKKAQALLDIINEINYFTSQSSSEDKTNL